MLPEMSGRKTGFVLSVYMRQPYVIPLYLKTSTLFKLNGYLHP
jgi:hypothetical protein